MAYTRTLADLKLSVQRRGQYEQSADITPEILTEILNDALESTYNLIVSKWDDYYLKVGASFSTVPGTDTYALPTDFYKLRLVEVQMDTQRWKALLPMAVEAMGRRTTFSLNSKDYRYRVASGNLILSPPPSTSGDTLRVWYLPLAPQLVNDSDVVTFDVPVEQRLVLAYALRDCYVRQDLPTDEVDRQIEAISMGLRTAADGHDANQPFYLDPAGPGHSYDDEDWWW